MFIGSNFRYFRKIENSFEKRLHMAQIAPTMGSAAVSCLGKRAVCRNYYEYASKWKGRCTYSFTIDTSIYLAESAAGKGLGAQLYRALLDQLRAKKVDVAIAGIALPNKTSIALHEKLGFAKVARFREVGFKLEKWIDVGYWQLLCSVQVIKSISLLSPTLMSIAMRHCNFANI